MKPIHIVALLTILLLTGCGGGGSGSAGTRMITIHIQWPSSTSRKTQRGASGPPPAQYVTVEAFDGVAPLGTVRVSNGTPDAQLSVPIKTLTFYAHAYAVALTTPPADANYTTDPKTGILFNAATGKLLAGTDTPQPVSQAVTTVAMSSLSSPPTVVFTMNNTIASIQPLGGKTSYALDNGNVNLNNTVQALAADGGVVLFDSSALQWSGPSDTLGSAVASVTNGVLTPTATGTAQLTVTDSEESLYGNQVAITANITYTITAPQNATDDVLKLTLNTQSGSNLMSSLARYAKSITLSVVQNSLATGDSPPAPISSPPILVTPSFTGTAITGVSLPASSISFTPTGRTVTLTVRSWSQTDGTGALLGSGSVTTGNQLPSATNPSTQDISLLSNVVGFQVSPPNPTITLVNPANGSPGFNQTLLQASAKVGGQAVPQRVDVRALNVALSPTNVVATSFVTDTDGNPSIQVIPAIPAVAGTTTVTVSDSQQPTLTGNTKITVVYGTGGAGLTIH